MKIVNTIITLIIGAGVGSGATYFIQGTPKVETLEVKQMISSSTSGTDDYEIRWYGKPKDNFFGGTYTVMKPNNPIEVIKIPKSPHIVKIKLPKGSTVGAGGNVQDIKIFRNGKECGKPGIVGDSIPLNKACNIEL